MKFNENLKLKVKHAYELSRLKNSLGILIWTLPLTALSLLACGSLSTSLCLGVLLSVLAVFLLWRGLVFERATFIGLTLGTIAFLVPVLLEAAGLCCRLNIEKQICFVTGVGVGIVLGIMIGRFTQHRLLFGVSAGALTFLGGLMGCYSLGTGAVVGLGSGILLALMTAYYFKRKKLI